MRLLFKEGYIGNLRLNNRIIMSAMHMGMSLDKESAFLAERAKGGAALVTVVMGVHPSAAVSDMNIICEENRQGIKDMADDVHKAGGKLCVQLFHIGRNAVAGTLSESKAIPVAPSAVPSPIYKTVPMELTEREIQEIVIWFARAAQICKDVGVDAVEISASVGYLLSEFLSKLTNLREDEYGGDFVNRCRFPLMVINAVREAVGEDYPVILRISGLDMLGGYSLIDMQRFSMKAERYVDAVSVTGGWHEAPIPQVTMQVPEGGFAFLAGAIKQVVDVPVVACNRINSGEVAEEILEEGYSNFVGSARAFLTDSHFAEKIKENIPYKKCVGCNKGCIENVLRGKQPTCIFNPTIGHEREMNETVEKVESKKVLVIGGGPAGLKAATKTAAVGHKVRLCTDEKQPGGSMYYASKAPDKQTFIENIDAMVYDAEEVGVEILTDTEVNSRYIEAFNPDEVIVATGGECFKPPIKGIDSDNVYTSKEIFDGSEDLLKDLLKKNVCIIGGGAGGVELAYFITASSKVMAKSRKFLDLFNNPGTANDFDYPGNITVLEMREKIGQDLGSTRWILMKEVKRYPIKFKTETVIKEIDVDTVVINEGQRIPADIVILATGYTPKEGKLINWLKEHSYSHHIIGDCGGREQGIMNAVREAYEIQI